MEFSRRFGVKPGGKVKLSKHDPDFHSKDRDGAEREIEKCAKRLGDLQDMLWAGARRSVLIVLQAMDTGGKDGTIKHAMGAMNPQGCRVVNFKEPSREDLAHDFLWRIHSKVPARGEVVIFNRSHYEDVLIVRVHDLAPKGVWSERYSLINAFEAGLAAAGTLVVKFFLHISREEQLERFKERLGDPEKWWKISESDYSERKRWDDYISAYEDAMSKCSTEASPWHIIPANRKWYRNLAVSKILVERMEAMDLAYPKPTVDIKRIHREFRAAQMK